MKRPKNIPSATNWRVYQDIRDTPIIDADTAVVHCDILWSGIEAELELLNYILHAVQEYERMQPDNP